MKPGPSAATPAISPRFAKWCSKCAVKRYPLPKHNPYLVRLLRRDGNRRPFAKTILPD